MTNGAVQFIAWAERYYGAYESTVKAEVGKRLDYEAQTRAPLFLEALRLEVMNGYSNRFRTPPDIATLNEFMRAAINRWRGMQGVVEANRTLPADVLPDPLTVEERAALDTMMHDLVEYRRIKNGK